MPYEPKCACGTHLFSDTELAVHLCNRCIDRQVARANRRQEWDHFHPGQAIPASELES